MKTVPTISYPGTEKHSWEILHHHFEAFQSILFKYCTQQFPKYADHQFAYKAKLIPASVLAGFKRGISWLLAEINQH